MIEIWTVGNRGRRTHGMLAVRLTALALVLPAMGHRTQAQAPIDCAKAMATAELNACADQELERADAALNAVYRRVLAKIAASDGAKPYDKKSPDYPDRSVAFGRTAAIVLRGCGEIVTATPARRARFFGSSKRRL